MHDSALERERNASDAALTRERERAAHAIADAATDAESLREARDRIQVADAECARARAQLDECSRVSAERMRAAEEGIVTSIAKASPPATSLDADHVRSASACCLLLKHRAIARSQRKAEDRYTY